MATSKQRVYNPDPASDIAAAAEAQEVAGAPDLIDLERARQRKRDANTKRQIADLERDLTDEIGRVNSTVLTTKRTESKNNATAHQQQTKLFTQTDCLGYALRGNIELRGINPDGLSAAVLNAAASGAPQADVDVTCPIQANAGTLDVPNYINHVSWPHSIHPKITTTKGTVADAQIGAPLYRQKGAAVDTVIGTATWGVDAWADTTAYVADDVVENSAAGAPGTNIYVCTGAGTSAGSGGPTGDTSGITDGSVTWDYVGPGAEAVLLTDTTTVPVTAGRALRKDADVILFEIHTVLEDVVAVLRNPHNHTLPSGAGATSITDLPVFNDDGDLSLTLSLDVDEGATKTYVAAEKVDVTVSIGGIVKPMDYSDVADKTLDVPIIA